MQHDFWLNCWQKTQIGFHQDELQPLLVEYFPTLTQRSNGNVLIPLCGKTSDLLYFCEHLNFNVIGNELSEIACQDFFAENNLPVEITKHGVFNLYKSEKLTIYQGDFFSLQPDSFTDFDWIYDRAAIIALPIELRKQYAEHIKLFLAEKSKLFLITLEFDQNEKPGPPFSVSSKEIHSLFNGYHIKEVANRDLTGKKFARAKLDVGSLVERLYVISKNDNL